MAIGFEILRIPFSMKYGMMPCKRFSDASESDAVSEAT